MTAVFEAAARAPRPPCAITPSEASSATPALDIPLSLTRLARRRRNAAFENLGPSPVHASRNRKEHR